LAEHPQEEAQTQATHGRYFAAFLRERAAHLHDGRQQTVLAEAWREMENVRAGWQWALARPDTAVLGHYLETMATVYLARSQFGEGQAVLRRAVERIQPLPDEPVLTARLLTWQARFEILLGAYETAEHCLQTAVLCCGRSTSQSCWDAP
jgi:hypothetical protein